MNRLLDIMTYRREHDSKGEKAFIKTYLKGFKPIKNKTGEILAYSYEIASKNKNRVLWSCHIDTMHRNQPDVIKQEVYIDPFDVAFVDNKSDCLGADNGAGVFLLLEMIDAGIAGTYLFHRGEEKGCWGSSQIASEYEEYLKNFTHAIAFDRKGTTSIITHQSGSRACSDKLGIQLANLFGMGYKLDDTGVYTDTAEYTHLIPECLNISIGYANEHTSKESLDVSHVMALRDKILSIQWDKITLKKDRKPEPKYSRYGYSYEYGLSYDDLLYMNGEQIKQWAKTASPQEVAYLIQDLVSQIEYYEQGYQMAYDDPNQEIPF